MANPAQLLLEGFLLKNAHGKLVNSAIISLKSALRAYFSTYGSMKYSLHLFDDNSSSSRATLEQSHSSTYIELVTETIIHFHHFAELILKDMLSAEHPVLALKTEQKHSTLHRLIMKEDIPDAELGEMHTLTFANSMARLCALINDNRISNSDHHFITHEKSWLKPLNELRNKLIHSGTFVLKYDALDKIVGGYILPFVKRVTDLSEYSDLDQYWKYQSLDCKLDPIDLILHEFTGDSYDIGKIALLKELGRAAYLNPLEERSAWNARFNEEIKNRALRSAKAELGEPNRNSVLKCPVCGIISLVVFDDIELEGEDPNTGVFDKAWLYTWQVKCMCCSYEVNHHLKNPKDYGLDLDNYWTGTQI